MKFLLVVLASFALQIAHVKNDVSLFRRTPQPDDTESTAESRPETRFIYRGRPVFISHVFHDHSLNYWGASATAGVFVHPGQTINLQLGQRSEGFDLTFVSTTPVEVTYFVSRLTLEESMSQLSIGTCSSSSCQSSSAVVPRDNAVRIRARLRFLARIINGSAQIMYAVLADYPPQTRRRIHSASSPQQAAQERLKQYAKETGQGYKEMMRSLHNA